MQQVLVQVFKEWVDGPLARHSFTDPLRYAGLKSRACPYTSRNPYIKSEADIQMKFGGFLAERLPSGLAVHAGLNPYRGFPALRSDLSVHRLPPDAAVQPKLNPVVDTVQVVIEVKYADSQHPDWLFEQGRIRQDLEKLACLPQGVGRVFLLLDESLRIDVRHIQETRAFARRHSITVLSNNEEFMREAA